LRQLKGKRSPVSWPKITIGQKLQNKPDKYTKNVAEYKKFLFGKLMSEC
jgi:hypothetical protein